MPRRTNVFQEVVAIIHEHMAEGATVEESAMLTNRATGRKREVDVVIRSNAATHELVIAVEATAGRRKASVEWVERMIGKHQNLPTDKLVLIAESGFRPQAREAAEAAGVATVTPEDLDADDPALEVLNQMRSLWPRFFAFLPQDARLWVDDGRSGIRRISAPPQLPVFLPSGHTIGPLHESIGAYLDANVRRFVDEMELTDVAEDLEQSFVLEIGPGWGVEVGGTLQQLHVRDPDTGELRRIDKLQLVGTRGRSRASCGSASLSRRRPFGPRFMPRKR